MAERTNMQMIKKAFQAMFFAYSICGGFLWAQGQTVESRVVYVTQEDVYIDLGSEAGLKSGDDGIIKRDGIEIGRLQIAEATTKTARAQITSDKTGITPRMGDRVFFTLHASPKPKIKDDAFIPLLAPQPRAAVSRDSNIFHGRTRLRYQFQKDPNSNRNYQMSRMSSDGSIERMGGTSWSAVWFGNLSYRDGNAFSSARDYRKPALDIFKFLLQRKTEAGGFLRLGRFLPQELSGAGYLDGVQGEKVMSDSVRIGNILGLKPTRDKMEPNVREPVNTAYLTFAKGERRSLYYSGTVGLLGTFFRNELDRTAILHEQQMDLGSKLSIFSSLEADANINESTMTAKSLNLTRISFFGNSPLTSILTLRAGFDHFERINSRAEREFMGITDGAITDPGYWRYWTGASQEAIFNLRFDEEISFISSPGEQSPLRWRGGITKSNLPFWPNAQISVTGYNQFDFWGEGYGGYASAYLPFPKNFMVVQINSGAKYSDTGNGKKLKVTDYSVQLDVNPMKSLGLYGGMSHTYGDFVDTTFYDSGISYRW